ncbi:hypothetical protein [Deefgea sp. CFH1-16]|uniref:hypothetical protein n=1 Tax=Deefgea sp. CFH1-16 TaxID=2675457 RepID=UPI0015F71BB6|nr:hypothetical protein [Deefgea sp. CFH1-16]
MIEQLKAVLQPQGSVPQALARALKAGDPMAQPQPQIALAKQKLSGHAVIMSLKKRFARSSCNSTTPI